MLATPTMASNTPPGLKPSRPSLSGSNHNDSFSDYDNSQQSPIGLSGPRSVQKHAYLQTQKFPHTRAQLANIAREYRMRDHISTSPSISTSSSRGDGDGLPPSNGHAIHTISAAGSADAHLHAERDAEHDHEQEEEVRVSSELVRQVAGLLDEEKEDELKELLLKTFEMDDSAADTSVLDLMHSHKDDISGVPFLFLNSARRPISRPSSRASNHSFRLVSGPPRADSPSSASAPSSPSLLGPIRRPHTPSMSPLATSHNASSYMTASPTSSPTFAHVSAASYLATSLPASPLSSPRMLNAKAHEFRPAPRPLSAASSIPGTSGSFAGRRNETPSPDLWAHGPGSLRGASKLAIASPLIPDNTLLPPGTPPRAHTPTSPLRVASHSGEPDDDEDDPFDPFAQAAKLHTTQSFHSMPTSAGVADYGPDPELSDWNGPTSYPEMFGGFDVVGDPMYGPANYYPEQQLGKIPPSAGGSMSPSDPDAEYDPDTAEMLTDGMTPFDVLSSVFGATLAPSELEEALAMNGYEFERAMQWLIERTRPQGSPPGQRNGQNFSTYAGGGVHIMSRGQTGPLARGGRSGLGTFNSNGRGNGRFGNGRGPAPNGNRVCRYFLAGECLRADCRFSHDLDRALCRFWLRGACAKGEACEFLHHLPNEVDVDGLSAAMSHTNINDPNASSGSGPSPQDDFPTLTNESMRGGRRGYTPFVDRGSRGFDPGRTRFANAVKKSASAFPGAPLSGGLAAQMASRREAKAAMGDSVFSRPTVIAPRPSPRIRLRVPLLLPTLKTGESVSTLYMSYRSRALQLGAARNACLSRAADAWRRGDGAAAKRFSREGHELNAKMSAENAEAAGKLVRARATAAETAVKSRDVSWSSEPMDRSSRGKVCGGGLGICLGVVGKEAGEEFLKLTAEKRTEVSLDLHGLHSNEATDVLEEFLLALEKEHFFGLAFLIVGEEKHTGTQDVARGASRHRLATGIREWLHNWGYPWNERDGIICVDPLTHMQ